MDKLKDVSGISGSGRTMKFPYTMTAQLRQFPFKYYWNNQWMFRYYLISLAVCIPVFRSISKLANSPENKKKWAEQQAKEAAEHH